MHFPKGQKLVRNWPFFAGRVHRQKLQFRARTLEAGPADNRASVEFFDPPYPLVDIEQGSQALGRATDHKLLRSEYQNVRVICIQNQFVVLALWARRICPDTVFRTLGGSFSLAVSIFPVWA